MLRMEVATVVFALLCLAASAVAQAPSAMNRAASWQPMAGSPSAQSATTDGKPAIRFVCDYAAKIERASWDCPVQLDMSRAQGLRFQLRCTNPMPVSSFSIYFQSGDGWYATTFAHPEADKWETIEVLKEQTHIEGKPAGWGSIRTIRVSAWRGGTENTEFAIADMALYSPNARIAVILGEMNEPKAADGSNAYGEYGTRVAGILRELRLAFVLLRDTELTPELLAPYKLIILPYSPDITPQNAAVVAQYMQQGGKVIDFYSLPAEIGAAGGVRSIRHLPQKTPGDFARIKVDPQLLPGAPASLAQRSWNILQVEPQGDARVSGEWLDESGKSSGMPAIIVSPHLIYMSHVLLGDDGAAKRQLLLAMIGALEPDLWRDAAQTRVDDLGHFASFTSFDDARKALSAKPTAAKDLAQAVQFHQDALAAMTSGKYLDVVNAADAASRALLLAYCDAQEPLANEQRAFWCHNAAGVPGMSWDQAIKNLADNGFNTIIPNMLWGGVAFYPSKVLPVAPLVAEKGDQVQQCLDACRKYGVKMHVWKVDWNMGWLTPKDFMARMKSEGRTQVSFDGTQDDRWLCPSHPANQQLEIDAMTELATMYNIDGIHFDYIRYPGPDGCFCPGCRERFEASLGHKLTNWPGVTRSDPDVRAKWLDFRRANITKVVSTVADKVHHDRPGMKVSAAVFTNLPVDRDGVGQDWGLWCEKGYMDFVCPMDYTAYNSQFEMQVTNQLKWAGKVPVYPGIGLSVWPGSSRDIVKLIEQIQITRKHNTGGFTIFQYDNSEANNIAPLCSRGVTRPR